KYVGLHGVMTEPNGLYYMRARYYDPHVGRFICEDPIGFEGGDTNLYVYVSNNPMMLVDPRGLCASSGRLTLSQANRHWQEGGGSPLVVDVGTLDLSNVSQLPPSGQVNFAGKNFSSVNDALVYGTVTLKSGPNNTVIGGFDYYNFDMKPWSSKTFVRNVETIIGKIYAGSGTPYRIEFTGTAPLGR
ncbi:MAG: RHS repeat-associated core domain-containing protein, partial [bacterium]